MRKEGRCWEDCGITDLEDLQQMSSAMLEFKQKRNRNIGLRGVRIESQCFQNQSYGFSIQNFPQYSAYACKNKVQQPFGKREYEIPIKPALKFIIHNENQSKSENILTCIQKLKFNQSPVYLQPSYKLLTNQRYNKIINKKVDWKIIINSHGYNLDLRVFNEILTKTPNKSKSRQRKLKYLLQQQNKTKPSVHILIPPLIILTLDAYIVPPDFSDSWQSSQILVLQVLSSQQALSTNPRKHLSHQNVILSDETILCLFGHTFGVNFGSLHFLQQCSLQAPQVNKQIYFSPHSSHFLNSHSAVKA